MDGFSLKQEFLAALNRGQEDMVTVDRREIWSNLDKAARLFCEQTKALTGECQITTVAGQQTYDIGAEFIDLRPVVFSRNPRNGRKVIARYVRDGITSWIPLKSYDYIFALDLSDTQQIPGSFAIIDKQSAETSISGTITDAGSVVNGECQLADGSAQFVTNGIQPRDTVVNTTRNATGVVLSVVSETRLTVAMFPEGLSSFRVTDAYIIQPQAHKQVMLEAPAEESGNVMTIPCYVNPAPVYSELGSWRLDPTVCVAIAGEAAFLFASSRQGIKAQTVLHSVYSETVRAERFRSARRALHGW